MEEQFEDLTVIVNWEVDDGYAGKSRPQTTEVRPSLDMDEEEWNEMTECELEEYLDEAVRADFEEKIGYVITDHG